MSIFTKHKKGKHNYNNRREKITSLIFINVILNVKGVLNLDTTSLVCTLEA